MAARGGGGGGRGGGSKEALDILFQMSNILETGLDRHTLSILVALCDRGVNPEALAALVREFSSSSSPSSSSSSTTTTPRRLSPLSRP